MATYKVYYNRFNKEVQVLGPDVANATPPFELAGTFVHDNDQFDGLGPEHNHVMYHHVRDALYHLGVQDMQSIPIQLFVSDDDPEELPKVYTLTLSANQIAENSPVDAVVGQFTLLEDGVDVSNAYQFLINPVFASPFKVVGRQLMVYSDIDYEVAASYEIQAIATISMQEAPKKITNFTIGITNVVEGTLAASAASSSTSDSAGTIISNVTGFDVGSNEKIASITPNDGRLAINGAGTQIVKGMTAATAGTINAVITTTTGRTLNVAITVTSPVKRMQVTSRAEQNFAKSGALTTANQRSAGRSRGYFSHDCNNLQVALDGYYVADIDGSNMCLETALGNDYTIRIALEYNGQTKQFLFDGSTAAKTIVSGSVRNLTDKLAASQFGLTKFTKGDQYWLRMDRVTPVGGSMLYHYANVNDPAITGERYFTAAVGATDYLLATSDWPVSGGWTAQSTVWLPAAVLGEVTGNKMSTVILGASLEHGAGDYGRGDGSSSSGGYIRQGFFTNKGAKIGLMKAGESAVSFLANSAKRQQYLQDGTHAFCGHGGNDYSYGYASAISQTRLETIWGLCKTAGLKTYMIALSPKTDSTDAWITQANQTPRAGFAVGGAWRDAINTYGVSVVGTKLDGVLNFNSSATKESADKWRTDLGQATLDGTHPTAVVHAAMGVDLRAKIETIRSAYEV